MFAAENLRDWVGYDVVDTEAAKIGQLADIYVDTVSDEPSFLTVRVGGLGRHRLVFVPAQGATVSPDAVRVRVSKKLAMDSPAIETDGELPAEEEPAIFEHYGMTYGQGAARRLARR
jgi:sporulation protein YlmC with PRC-barrel domain